MAKEKVTITCALTGVLTDPEIHSIPVTPEEMAQEALDAYNAGASIVHVHFRQQGGGLGKYPSWDPKVAVEICMAIRNKAPKLLINMSTGVIGDDISGPLGCLEDVRPEIAALNAGSLNYLKVKRDGSWAWRPLLFDNPVPKIERYLEVMNKFNVIPECECFDTGIVRSIDLFKRAGLLKDPVSISLVMGVPSGMPANPNWLPLLVEEMPEGCHWQTIGIGRQEVWELHRKTIELGGDVRTGLEDTFYLPNGKKSSSNGELVDAMAMMIRESGKDVANPEETRVSYGLK